MNSSRFTRFAATGLAAVLAATLTACDLLGDDGNTEPKSVSGLESSWIGKPLDSLMNAGSVAFGGGLLYVANGHETSPGIAAVDTATGAIVAYYPTPIAPAGLAFTASGKLVVTETDYASGAVSVIDPAAGRIRQDVIPFGTDPGVSAVDGTVYLFDHTTGAVTGFTGDVPGKNVVLDVQSGAGANPYGIALLDGKAYVTRYNSTSLLILNDASAIDGGTRDSIDLSAYASRQPVDTAAEVPRMAHVVAAGGRVFVTLQRLNYSYAALDTSLVVVIDAATKTIEKTIPLAYRNPVSAKVRDGVWYIAGVYGYGDQLGGVEKIDLATAAHAGTVVTEETLGGDVSSYVPVGAGGYAVYSTGWPVYRVKKIAD